MEEERARMKGHNEFGCSKKHLKNRYKTDAENASSVKQQPVDPRSQPGGGGARVREDPL